MTALAIQGHQSFLASPRNTGSSACSEHIFEVVKETIEHLREPVSQQKPDRLYSELDGIFLECSEKNWDGYDAAPISTAAISEAGLFLSILPSMLPLPEIVPEPTGALGFEWNFGKNKVFAVSVKGNHSIAYAGLLGAGSKISGIEVYSESIPSIIIESIQRVST